MNFGQFGNATSVTPLPAADAEDTSSVLWKLSVGLPGATPRMTPEVITLQDGGEQFILVGTDEGIAAIDMNGLLEFSFLTFGAVFRAELIQDLDGDGKKDIVIIVDDQEHPNIYAISSNKGKELWKFDTVITGFNPTTVLKQNYTSLSWDVAVLNDIDNDGVEDVAISSWFRVFAISGATGKQIWKNADDFTDDIFYLQVIEDGSNNQHIVGGSEKGEVVALDSQTGSSQWDLKIAPRNLPAYVSGAMAPSVEAFPTAVADLQAVRDVDGDGTTDLLLAADDGTLQLLSGATGTAIGSSVGIFELMSETQPISFPSSPYTLGGRFMGFGGVRITPLTDISGNDGHIEYLTRAYDLDYSEPSTNEIVGYVVDLAKLTGEDSSAALVKNVNWTYSKFQSYSNPAILDAGNGDVRTYFYKPEGTCDGQGCYPDCVVYYGIDDNDASNAKYAWKNWNANWEDSANGGSFLINVGDQTGDGHDDLFLFKGQGKGIYSLIDVENDRTVWTRKKQGGTTDVSQINDVNGDGLGDFLLMSKVSFAPEWARLESQGGNTKSIIEGMDCGPSLNVESSTVINEFLVLDAATGDIIWTFQVPDTDLYDGLREVVSLGDLNGDGISDYAGWMIPTRIPDSIKTLVQGITGEESIRTDEGQDSTSNSWRTQDIYRALLVNHTRLVSINGATGTILTNIPLIDYTYNFFRRAYYEGTYLNPQNTNDYDDLNQFYHRTNGIGPNDFFSYPWDTDQKDFPMWRDDWDPSLLFHASTVDIESGETPEGTLFDLWDSEGETYSIRSTNATAVNTTGLALNETSTGTVATGDEKTWALNSSLDGGDQKIAIETSFYQTQSIESPLQDIEISYKGTLSSQLSSYRFYAYQFGTGTWQQISTDGTVNKLGTVTTKMSLPNVDAYRDAANNNRTRIKVEGSYTSAFTLSIDELVADYQYVHGNYSVNATWDAGQSQWETILNFTMALNFSAADQLGLLEFPLSQLERISGLKFQTELQINNSINNDYYNWTYQIYNVTAKKWVECNWTQDDSTKVRWWSEGEPLQDLYVGWDRRDNCYRDSKWKFGFNPGTYQQDFMYVTTRGIRDDETNQNQYSAVELDTENRTTLSHFVNLTTGEIKISVNITCAVQPFELTWDTFGIGAFYWGLAPGYYDPLYIYSSKEWNQETQSNSGGFTNYQIKNLAVQDFQAVNWTGDGVLDVLAVIGFSGDNCQTNIDFSTTLRLIDMKTGHNITKWGLNQTAIPWYKVKAFVPSTSEMNGWGLLGTFESPESDQLLSLQKISNGFWDDTQSPFANYTGGNASRIDYEWNITIGQGGGSGSASGGFIEIKKDGSLGFVSVKNDENGQPQYLQVLDLATQNVISLIPLEFLFSSTDSLRNNLQAWQSVDLSDPTSLPAKIKLSMDDFNGDGYLDHGAWYMTTTEWSDEGFPHEMRIYSGNGGADTPALVWSKSVMCRRPEPWGGGGESYMPSGMPFDSIGDFDGDGNADLIFGLEGAQQWGSVYDAGSSLTTVTTLLNTPTESDWVLTPFKQLYSWQRLGKQYWDHIDNIGDFNGDGYDDLFVGRHIYRTVQDQFGNSQTTATSVTEVLDVKNQKILTRFVVSADSIYQISDLTGDGEKENILVSGAVIYCLNSEFKVALAGDLEDGKAMASKTFTLSWSTNNSYSYFEVFVDGNSYGPQQTNTSAMNLGAGERMIEVFMYDESGVLVAVDSVRVTIPADNTMMTVTIVGLAAVIGIGVVYNVLKKKKARKIVDTRVTDSMKMKKSKEVKADE